MPTVMVTFIQAKFVLATIVHIRNISDVTDPIFTKTFGANILGPKFVWTNILFDLNLFVVSLGKLLPVVVVDGHISTLYPENI